MLLPVRAFIRTLFLPLAFFFSYTAIAQQSTQVYYDVNWKKCNPEKAFYFVIIEKTDSGYYRRNYFVNNSKLQMAALYEDSASKTGNGYATYFYATGALSRRVQMVHGKTEGVDIRVHNNGQMADSGTYHNGQPVGDVFSWHYNGYIADSITHINDSTFVHVSWFDDGTPAAAGKEINGKKQGPWVFYHHNGNRAAREIYERGKRISVQHFDESGNEVAVDTARNEHAAEFKGGINNWWRYMERSLNWPAGYSFPNTTQVVMQVEVTIAEDGKITNVYVVNPFHPAFDKVAYETISKGPKWIPAIQHNRPVQYRFRQTVTFEQR